MNKKDKNNNCLVFADNGYLSYIDFSKLSFADKLRRRLNVAKALFDNGSLVKAGYALLGGYDPENPRLSTGDVPNPGMRNPKQVIGTVQKAKSIGLKLSKLTDAERAGIPKGERNNRFIKAKSSVNENYTRLNNLSLLRKKFMEEHPIKEFKTNDDTNFERELKNAQRIHANNPEFSKRNYEDHIEYNADLDGDFGYSESSLFLPDRMYKPYAKHIKLVYSKNDKSPIARIVKSHEVKHYTGNDADSYIYEYLRQNKIIDDSKISKYHKDADRGEIGTHLGEFADFLGATKPYKSNQWRTGSGNLKATSEDLNEFIKFNKDLGFMKNGTSIFENILDKEKFLEFFNTFGFKQGGKMNILEFLKKGSGIHIKEKNKGSFTRWCGGNVTEECIRRGKNSPNAAIRKKATFADNARHFKHKKGGKAFVNGVNVLDSNPKMSKAASRKVKKANDGIKLNGFLKIGNFLNSDTGKAISGTLINGLSAGFQAKQMNNAINEYELASKAKLKKILNGVYSKDYYNQALLTMNPNENLSSVVLLKRAYDIGLQEAQKMYNEAKDKLDLQMVGIKLYANELTLNNFSNVLGGITLLGSLLNNKSASKVDNGTPSTTNFWNNPTIRNSQVTGDFWNNPTIANSIT